MMAKATKDDLFSKEVQEKLGYYVYRLIDPRNGQTFYVGKGRRNRVFEHVKAALKAEESSEEGLRLETIRKIKQKNLTPIHVIHRHNMSEHVALEVEAALIDAYPGLTNQEKNDMNSTESKRTRKLAKSTSINVCQTMIARKAWLLQCYTNTNNGMKEPPLPTWERAGVRGPVFFLLFLVLPSNKGCAAVPVTPGCIA